MTVCNKKVVAIHYTLTNDSGEELESTKGSHPFEYLHGAGNIIKGLENALENKNVGEKIKVVIEPEEGYGVRKEKLVQIIPRDKFEGIPNLAVGLQLKAETSQGDILLTVTKIDDEQVTVDANHQFAGERLHFDVSIESIRDANSDELAHGHVHSGDCGH